MNNLKSNSLDLSQISAIVNAHKKSVRRAESWIGIRNVCNCFLKERPRIDVSGTQLDIRRESAIIIIHKLSYNIDYT
jgi:hypothetical protein